MRPTRLLLAGALVAILSLSGSTARAQVPGALPNRALRDPATRAAGGMPTGTTWGPAKPPTPPTRWERFKARFTRSSSSNDGVKVYYDPATGRTNTGGTKPWYPRMK